MYNIKSFQFDYDHWRRGEKSFATLAPYHFDCPNCGNGLLTYIGNNKAQCNYYRCLAVVPCYDITDLIIPECLRSHSDMPFSGNHGTLFSFNENGRIIIFASSREIPDCRDSNCKIHHHDMNETFSKRYVTMDMRG